eukprot:TRINITY_DN45445_c0_g1_i1.p2 TRINITY_DN45445_c0_g1~~TRINITY_DN45445_c0_g1_i1.p2  ORF type:complete len:143 (-),score=25.16 TRINITY_DN45445_c0_g1_i1:49-477(-)
MAFLLPNLYSGWAVDCAIQHDDDRIVVIRFGIPDDPRCAIMDHTLSSIAETLKQFAVIYLVDTRSVKDFTAMYELIDPVSVMFFWRNKIVQVELGTGQNHKLTFPITDKQEMIDLVETVYRGARKGRGIVVAPRNYSTACRY